VTSRNLVSVRILDAIGVPYARRYMQGFGFAAESLPPNLSLALGTASLPPLALARGYAVFANGGYLVDPYLVERVHDRDGVVVQQARPLLACRECGERLLGTDSGAGGGQDGFDLSVAGTRSASAGGSASTDAGPPERFLAPRAVDERTTYLVQSLLRDVVRRGTGRGALVLERNDVGGKTGTTNDFRDAWFSGFAGNVVTTAWVGMDDFSSLGRGEFASKAALPMWTSFMKVALDGVPEAEPPLPNGLVTALIDPSTGRLVPAGSPGAMAELFKAEDIARLESRSATDNTASQREAFDIF
jgi:penicillin-binding protein 1A